MRMRAAALLGVSAIAVVPLSGQSGRGAPADFTLLDLNGRSGMALPAPPGATVFRGGGAAFSSPAGGSYESDLRLEGAFTAAQIAAHYAAQISAANWRPLSPRADGEDIVAQWFSSNTTSGDPLTMGLVVTRLSATRFDVAVRSVRHRPALPPPMAGVSGRAGGTGASARGGTPPAPKPSTPESILRADALTVPAGQPYEVQSRMPAGFPKELLPEGAMVGIAAVSQGMVTVVATVPAFSMSSVTRHVLALRDSGWIDNGVVLGVLGRGDISVEVCQAPKWSSLRFSPRESGGIYVRAAVSSPGQCRGPGTFSDVALPVLVPPPPDVRWVAGSGGGGREAYHWAMRVSTTQSVASIASHYAVLMTKSGWPASGRAEVASISIARHISTTISGDPITAILSVVRLGGTSDVDLWLRVVRSTSPH